jgi:hypothetical protein
MLPRVLYGGALTLYMSMWFHKQLFDQIHWLP